MTLRALKLASLDILKQTDYINGLTKGIFIHLYIYSIILFIIFLDIYFIPYFLISLFVILILDSLFHRRTFSALSLYYRYYHGMCSDKLELIIPPKALFLINVLFPNTHQQFALKLDKNRINGFGKTFIFILTPGDYNFLHVTVFFTT